MNSSRSRGRGDPIYGLGYLFPGPGGGLSLSCEDACDGNDDGALNLADPIVMLTALFAGGTIPPPHPGCGLDPTIDTLTCVLYSHCP